MTFKDKMVSVLNCYYYLYCCWSCGSRRDCVYNSIFFSFGYFLWRWFNWNNYKKGPPIRLNKPMKSTTYHGLFLTLEKWPKLLTSKLNMLLYFLWICIRMVISRSGYDLTVGFLISEPEIKAPYKCQQKNSGKNCINNNAWVCCWSGCGCCRCGCASGDGWWSLSRTGVTFYVQLCDSGKLS